jgi:hypothetical protein
MNCRQALLGCSSGQLSRMAAAWNLDVESGTLRRELVEALAERILAAVGEASTWAALDTSGRRAIRLMARAGGRHEVDFLTRRLSRAGSDGGPSDEPCPDVEAAIADLVDRGFLFRTFDADEQRRGVYLVMADEILDAARQRIGEGASASSLVPAEPPAEVASCDLAADLFVLASALRREAWGSASRGLARRPARSVGQILALLRTQSDEGPGDPGRRWRFLLWIAQRAGWIGRGPLPLPDESQIERLLANPIELPALALSAGPVVTGGGPAISSEGTGGSRRQSDALQLLSELSEGGWWKADALAEWLASELGDGDDASTARDFRVHRHRIEGQIARWLEGRWLWLGLVRWGRNGPDWSVVTPTPALRSIVTGRPAADADPPRPCVLDGPLQLRAPAGADLAGLLRAERYLAYAAAGSGDRRYSLTPATFDRGVRLGGDAAELLGLIERIAQQPLPPDWAAAVDQWSDRASRLRLAARLVLSSDGEQVLDEALSTTSAGYAVVEKLSPRHAIVDGHCVADLLADLSRAGLAVEIDAGLRVEPVDAGRSAALANGVAETAWVALEVLRRLAPEVVAEQRDLQSARGQLDALLVATLRDALDRRAATIVSAITNRRRPRPRRRVV